MKRTLYLFLVILFIIPALAFADTTAVLRPTGDGGDDSADWKNTLGAACNTVDCYIGLIETSGAFCTDSDGNTTFISSGTDAVNQTFDIDESSIPDGSTITNIDVKVCHKWQGGGPTAPTFQTRICLDGSCSNSGSNFAGAGSYQENSQSHIINFTKTASSDIEIGALRTNAKNLRVSQISAVITYAPPPSSATPTPPGGGAGSVPPTTVTFAGQAYPSSTVELLRKSFQDEIYKIFPTKSVSVSEDGTFEISQIGLLSDEYFIALQITDKDGRKTTISFDANLLNQSSFFIKNIFAPPTLGLKNTLLARAEDLELRGYAAPNNVIEMEIDGISQKETALSDTSGHYTLRRNIAPFSVGTHYAKVRQVDKDGKKSDFSVAKAFKKSLLTVLLADFNNDGYINITDWSVFLFRWESQDPKLKSTLDLDGNETVDIFDLSVFLKAMEV